MAAIALDALDTHGHIRRCLVHRLILRIRLLDRTLAIVKEKISIEEYLCVIAGRPPPNLRPTAGGVVLKRINVIDFVEYAALI